MKKLTVWLLILSVGVGAGFRYLLVQIMPHRRSACGEAADILRHKRSAVDGRGSIY